MAKKAHWLWNTKLFFVLFIFLARERSWGLEMVLFNFFTGYCLKNKTIQQLHTNTSTWADCSPTHSITVCLSFTKGLVASVWQFNVVGLKPCIASYSLSMLQLHHGDTPLWSSCQASGPGGRLKSGPVRGCSCRERHTDRFHFFNFVFCNP